jgi:hypothetical protein
MPRLFVAGSTGVTGNAIVQHFTRRPDWEVIAVSRREPWLRHPGAEFNRRDTRIAKAARRIPDATDNKLHPSGQSKDRVDRRLALRDQNLDLAQLRYNLLRLVYLPRHP